jgi:hypothetical protein
MGEPVNTTDWLAALTVYRFWYGTTISITLRVKIMFVELVL